MTDVMVTVELSDEDYGLLLAAANESGISVSDFCNRVIRNYVEENYGQV